MRSHQAGKAMTRGGKWTIDVRGVVLFAIAVAVVAAILSLLNPRPSTREMGASTGERSRHKSSC
jgi:hypothetical protein